MSNILDKVQMVEDRSPRKSVLKTIRKKLKSIAVIGLGEVRNQQCGIHKSKLLMSIQ